MATELQRFWRKGAAIETLIDDVPEWIEWDLTPNEIAGINQWGIDCSCSAFIEYSAEVMAEHGNAVREYLVEVTGTLPDRPESLGGYLPVVELEDGTFEYNLDSFYLSSAIEHWAREAAEELDEIAEAVKREGQMTKGEFMHWKRQKRREYREWLAKEPLNDLGKSGSERAARYLSSACGFIKKTSQSIACDTADWMKSATQKWCRAND